MASRDNNNVLLVTIKFKKRGLMPNEFTVRLASVDFSETHTIEELIEEGFKKLQSNSLTARNFFYVLPQRLLGYGKHIGYHRDSVLAVYTEKDRGRVAMNDIARYVLVNNETIVVEYYDRRLTLTVGILSLAGLAYFGYNLRRYMRYRIYKSQSQ